MKLLEGNTTCFGRRSVYTHLRLPDPQERRGEVIWFWLSDTSHSSGLAFWCSLHNGLISTHLDMWKKKKKKIHLEKFAVNLCAYLAEVILWYNIVKSFIEPFCSRRSPKSITSSRFYQYDTCLDSNFSKCLPVSKWQTLHFSKRDIILASNVDVRALLQTDHVIHLFTMLIHGLAREPAS